MPDGKIVVVQHEKALTDDDVRNVAKEMGYEFKDDGFSWRDIAGEGTRIGGAVAGAIAGSKAGPYGAGVGGLLGALAVEPAARSITPREESTGESVANVLMGAVQPEAKAAGLAARLIRGAKTGAALSVGHKTAQTLVDEERLPQLSELPMPAGAGAVIGGGLEAILGPRLGAQASKAIEEAKAPLTKEGAITASLDKPKASSLEVANAQANEIAAPSATTTQAATPPATKPAPPTPTPAQAASPAFTMPKELAGAKPRYSYGADQYSLKFDDDLDRALYILAQKKPSKRDADYLKAVLDHTGMSEADARAMGAEIRASIKKKVEDGAEDEIRVEPIASQLLGAKKVNTPPVANPTPQKPNFAPTTVGSVEVGDEIIIPDQMAQISGHSGLGLANTKQGVVVRMQKDPVTKDMVPIIRTAQGRELPVAEWNTAAGVIVNKKKAPSAPAPVAKPSGKRVSVEDEDAIDAEALAQSEGDGSVATPPQEPAPAPVKQTKRPKKIKSDAIASPQVAEAPAVSNQAANPAEEALAAAQAKPREEWVADRAEYESLQAQMGKAKPGTKEYNDLWAKSEAIKNKYTGMPPPEVPAVKEVAKEAPIAKETPPIEPPQPPEVPSMPPEGSDAKKGIRKPAKRVLDSDEVNPEFKAAVKDNPEILYDVQNQRAWVDKAKAAPTNELRQMADDASDRGEKVVYLAEYRNRLINEGKHKEAAAIEVERATHLTPGGQLLAASRLVRNPLLALAEVEERAAKVGKFISEENRQKIVDLSAKEIAAKDALTAAERKAREDFTKPNVQAYQKALREHAESKIELEEFTNAVTPRHWDDMIANFIRGNLQTLISPISGFAGNVLFKPLTRASESIATALDAVIAEGARLGTGSQLPARRSIMKLNPLSSEMETQAFIHGVKTGAKEILKGPTADSAIMGEIQRGFRPLRSLVDAFSGRNLPVNEAGQVSLEHRLKAFTEATLGVAPETLFRVISLSDKPFRTEAYTRELANQARLHRNKLEIEAAREFRQLGKEGPRNQMLRDFREDHFMMFPTASAEQAAHKAAGYVTFSSKNPISNLLNRALSGAYADKIPMLRGAIKVLGTMAVPFRQFPVNYAITALNFAAPNFAIAKGFYYNIQSRKALMDKSLTAAQQAERAIYYRRKGLVSVGEALVGMMMYGAASILWDKGLLSEKVGKTEAERSRQAQAMGSQRLNISGLTRYLEGGDPTYRTGDTTIDWSRMGIPAAVFAIHSDQKMGEVRQAEKVGQVDAKKPSGDGSVATWLGNSASAIPALGSFVFDQSFLSGTNAILEALKEADPESPAWHNMIANLGRATMSIAVPSETEAVARARLEYIPELRGKNDFETLNNIWKFKTFQTPSEDAPLAFKRDIWGNKVKRTGDGANPYIYGLVDPLKTSAKEFDRYDAELMNLYKETSRPSVYPNPVGRAITSPTGDSYKLDPDDYEKLQEIVGKYRREAVEQFMNDKRFYDNFEPQEKVLALEKLYEDANKRGRDEFEQSSDIYRRYFSKDSGRVPDSRSTESLVRDEPDWNKIRIGSK